MTVWTLLMFLKGSSKISTIYVNTVHPNGDANGGYVDRCLLMFILLEMNSTLELDVQVSKDGITWNIPIIG